MNPSCFGKGTDNTPGCRCREVFEQMKHKEKK